MSDALRIDPDDLTIGDLEDFEDIVGASFDDAMRPGPNGEVNVSAKALKALVFLSMRRDNPSFTLDDARTVKVSELKIGSEEDPTDAAGSSS